jgi:hypothetical protein
MDSLKITKEMKHIETVLECEDQTVSASYSWEALVSAEQENSGSVTT